MIVTGRAAALIRWLAEQQRELNAGNKGCLQVDFHGKSLVKRLTRVFDN